MACRLCDRPVRVPSGPGQVFISVPVEELARKVLDAVRGWPESFVPQDGSLEGQTDDFAGFLARFRSAGPWSDLEQDGLYVLFLPPGQPLSFTAFREARSLRQWASVDDASFLTRVIEDQGLVTHFQPIWDLRTGAVHGWECLSRGLDPQGGLISPDRLFGAAAASGMLFPLDKLARQTSLREAARRGLPGRLFINFIPTAIYDPVFCLRSTTDLARTLGIEPGRIVFEVVETEQVGDEAHLKGIADYYRAQGFHLALDDVGSGYSSLNLLVALRPDVIKVDRKIIQDIGARPSSQAVFRALVSIAAETGALLLAEGVETGPELDWVRSAGADLAQGYYWGKPLADPTF